MAFKDQLDVLIICGGSATDLPIITPSLAKDFNVVDSFDTHAKIPSHFDNVNNASLENGRISLISSGWDPGMFSIQRLYSQAILPNGTDYTFWGRGVSQGHSDAIRRIDGVIDAKQYTVPVEDALNSVRNGDEPTLSTRQKHLRKCYVVVKDGADKDEIERQIKQMPNYFADYDTTVNFISLEELKEMYEQLPLPKRATKGSAGYDFFMPFGMRIHKGTGMESSDYTTIPTGIRWVTDNKDVVLMLFPRSGLGFKSGTYLANTVGVIDSDYA